MGRDLAKNAVAVVLVGLLAVPALWHRSAKAQYLGANQPAVPAVPFRVQGPPCNFPATVASAEFQSLDAPVKIENCMLTPFDGYQRGAIGAHTSIDMNGKWGKAWTAYFSADCFGSSGNTFGECGALYARVEPVFGGHPLWHFGLHSECRNRGANPGICGGLNIELRDHYKEKHGTPSSGEYIGINIQPSPEMRNVKGIQFQHGQAYQYTLDHDSAFERLGHVDGTPFCWKFEPTTQQLLLVRGCHLQGAQVAHVIDVNWRPNLPMYVPGRRY
jgi:hypothetical protein